MQFCSFAVLQWTRHRCSPLLRFRTFLQHTFDQRAVQCAAVLHCSVWRPMWKVAVSAAEHRCTVCKVHHCSVSAQWSFWWCSFDLRRDPHAAATFLYLCRSVRQCAAVCGSVRRCSFDAATPVHNTFLYHQQQIRIKQLSFESRFDFQIFICIPRLLHLT